VGEYQKIKTPLIYRKRIDRRKIETIPTGRVRRKGETEVLKFQKRDCVPGTQGCTIEILRAAIIMSSQDNKREEVSSNRDKGNVKPQEEVMNHGKNPNRTN